MVSLKTGRGKLQGRRPSAEHLCSHLSRVGSQDSGTRLGNPGCGTDKLGDTGKLLTFSEPSFLNYKIWVLLLPIGLLEGLAKFDRYC